MRIGELAERSGVSVRALRYYEEQGLLYSTRSSGGQRVYAAPSTERVRLIQQLYSAGLSSRTIADLLPCVDANESTPESRARLAAERSRIDGQIAQLTEARDRLDAIIRATEDPGTDCTYLADPAPASATLQPIDGTLSGRSRMPLPA